MTEADWVELIAKHLGAAPLFQSGRLTVETRFRLAYGHEVSTYGREGQPTTRLHSYQTDMIIVEHARNGDYWPRVVVEAKIRSVSTHDAITYSAKAAAHRAVHPYLRYGMMLGKRGNFPLPWRLYSHGTEFDFMISFKSFKPSDVEMRQLSKLLHSEVQASRTLQRILTRGHKGDHDLHTMLHRKLEVR